jgi:UDP:flavonoid glycosyltransferase YjiC (YdhE family)
MRILFAVWGSAGDLFPVMPLAKSAERAGHEVRFAASRTLALYLRALRLNPVSYGLGLDAEAARDPNLLSTRFFGWESWRRLFCNYIGRDLPESTRALERSFAAWTPDVVVTTTFAAAARLAAKRQSIPLINTSIYPQHRLLTRKNRRFASTYTDRVVAVADKTIQEQSHVASLAWGVDESTFWLHDPALLGNDALADGIDPVGFPYWDLAVESNEALQTARTFMDAGPERPTLVTFGSFSGLMRQSVIEATVRTIRDRGERCIVLGAPRSTSDNAISHEPEVLFTGFVSLSKILSGCRYVVHHGGIGTTFAAILARRPAVVLPQAFDQTFNARLVQQAGIGIDGSQRSLSSSLTELRRRTGIEQRLDTVADRLRPPTDPGRLFLDRLASSGYVELRAGAGAANPSVGPAGRT